MSELQHKTFDNFLAGLNVRDADYLVAMNELTGGQNCLLSAKGKPSKRPGYEIAYIMPENPKSIYRFYKESDGTKYTIISGGTKLYSGTTQKYTGLTADKTFYWQDWYESLTYGVNGADGLFKFDGTNVTKVSDTNINAIVPKYITFRSDRLFVANNKELWWSDLGQPEVWDGASMLTIPLFEGEVVTGIRKVFNNIAIYKNRGVMLLRGGTDPNTFALEDIEGSYGLIAPKTLASIEGGHVGLCRDGLFFFNGSKQELLPNMEKVYPIIKDADPESLNEACIAVHGRLIKLTFPNYGSSTNDKTLVYDLDLGVFLPVWTNIYANMYSSFEGNADDNLLYFASSNDNNVYRFVDTLFTDNGTNIDWFIETANYHFALPANNKKFKRVRLGAESGSGTLKFSYKLDGQSYTTEQDIPFASTYTWGTPGLLWGVTTVKWGQGIGILEPRISNSSKGKYIKYKIRHNGPGDVEFVKITQFFRVKRAK